MITDAPAKLYNSLKTELGMTDRDIVSHLTPKLGNLYRLIGLPATIALIEGARGGQVYIPLQSSLEKNCRLCRIVGESAAERIIEEFGEACHIVVANPFGTRFWQRHRAMKAIKDGWSINRVSAHFGVSFQSVRNWRKTMGLTA